MKGNFEQPKLNERFDFFSILFIESSFYSIVIGRGYQRVSRQSCGENIVDFPVPG